MRGCGSAETVRRLVADMRAVCAFDRAMLSGDMAFKRSVAAALIASGDGELRRVADMWAPVRMGGGAGE